MSQDACRIGPSFGEGAERLDQLIRGVKDRQFSEVLNQPQPKGVRDVYAVSPQEEWSKKFMTAGIGPHDFKPVQMPAVSIAAPSSALKPAPKTLEPAIAVAAPAVRSVPKAAPPAKAAAAPTPAAPAPAKPAPAKKAAASPGAIKPQPIGAAIAKPSTRRSWFGRLVRGS